MAFIRYLPLDEIPEQDRVEDTDNILRIHSVHARTAPLHYALYRELMYAKGPLTRVQRESVAVAVSAANACRY